MECSICGDLFPQAELSSRSCCCRYLCSQCREESPHCIDCDKFITTREVNQEQLQLEISRIQEIAAEQTSFYHKYSKGVRGAKIVDTEQAQKSDAKAIRLHLELLQDLQRRLATLPSNKTVIIPVATFIRSKDYHYRRRRLVNSNGYLRAQNSTQREFYERHHINYSCDKTIPVNCTYLSHLDLSETLFFNITGLAGATRLVNLNLSKTFVEDLSPLSKLALVSLDISYTYVRDLTALTSMTTLQNLTAIMANITDISSLTGLNLKTLMLGRNYIIGLAALANMPLTKLNLACVSVNDITVLATLKDLTWLSLADSRVSDLTALQDLKLVELDLNNSQVTNLTPLASMTTLRKLNIASTRVRNIRPVQDIPGLKIVSK